ncbi:MAG: asparaginase [Pyrinomonadaceae bacterium]
MKSEILAEVIRSETVESIHRGHLIILNADGETLFEIGDPEMVTFFRSASKALQAIPCLTSGAAEYFNFGEKEIALACASHSGEEIHTKIAAGMLEKIGLNESDLRCGAHLPFNEKRADEMIRNNEKPTQLHNNCSGKHAAMLAFAKFTNADIETYEHIENPIQQKILETIALFTNIPKDEIKLAVDGCCAPNFAVSLKAMARSFVKLVDPPDDFEEDLKTACRKIVEANIKHPELIGGTERLDTLLLEAGRGQFITKIGADGVWLCGILPSEKFPRSLGIALKIEDGDDKRARAVISVEILRQLGIFDEDTLKEISPLPILNRRSETVGKVKAVFNLNLNK